MKEETATLNITVIGRILEQATSFLYLGHKLVNDSRSEMELKKRIGMMKIMFNKIKRY